MVSKLDDLRLGVYVVQRIQERANLGHLYEIEDTPDGPMAYMTEAGAKSIWRVVQDALDEAGWRIMD